MVINTHYCMDKIASVKIDNFSSNGCTSCGAVAKSGCCRNEFKLLKLSDVHQPLIEIRKFKCLQPFAALVSSYRFSFSKNYITTQAIAHAPPLLLSSDILLKNCVFRV